MKLVNLALSPEEAKEHGLCCAQNDASADNLPKYPTGLSLHFNDTTLEKMGINALPTVGQRFVMTAIVEVTSVSQFDSQRESSNSAAMQITDMDLAQRAEGGLYSHLPE